jgi:hypothetical protein
MDNFIKLIITSLIGGIAFVLFEIVIGYTVINILGLYDPYPRSAEYGSIINSSIWSVFIYFCLYMFSLLIIQEKVKMINYKYLVSVAIISALILSIFNRWYAIPREELFWLVWFLPIIFIFVVISLNKFIANSINRTNNG